MEALLLSQGSLCFLDDRIVEVMFILLGFLFLDVSRGSPATPLSWLRRCQSGCASPCGDDRQPWVSRPYSLEMGISSVRWKNSSVPLFLFPGAWVLSTHLDLTFCPTIRPPCFPISSVPLVACLLGDMSVWNSDLVA